MSNLRKEIKELESLLETKKKLLKNQKEVELKDKIRRSRRVCRSKIRFEALYEEDSFCNRRDNVGCEASITLHGRLHKVKAYKWKHLNPVTAAERALINNLEHMGYKFK